MEEIKTTYDEEVNAVYVTLIEGVKTVETKEVYPDLNVDLDKDGRIVGIEILNALPVED